MGIVTTQGMVEEKARQVANETFSPGTNAVALEGARETLRARIVELFGAGGDLAMGVARDALCGKEVTPGGRTCVEKSGHKGGCVGC